MKELTDSAVINDAVYEMNRNGSYPKVKLSVNTVKENESVNELPEEFRYHFTFPGKDEAKLYDQPLTEGGNVPVYGAGKPIEGEHKCCCSSLEKGESKIITGRKVIAHGPVWVWAAIAVGFPAEGSEAPFLVVEAAGTFGEDSSTENDTIGYLKEQQHEMTARLVRRAHLRKLELAAIRTEYKYVFVESDQVGKAKVKQVS